MLARFGCEILSIESVVGSLFFFSLRFLKALKEFQDVYSECEHITRIDWTKGVYENG